MGAWTQSLAVRTGDRNAVRQILMDWMGAKGFVLDTQPRLFACDEERERGFYLFGNLNWTIVLYSQKFDEYERLSLELKKLHLPQLFLFCFDSDEWGYRLDRGHETLDEFLVRTIHLSWPPQTAGHAAKLCDSLDLSIDSSKLARIMRRRAVFSETVLQDFCEALDMTPAGIDFDDVESVAGSFEGVRKVAGFDVEPMIFVRRNAFNAMYPLHTIKVHDSSPQPQFEFAPSPEMEQWVANARTQVQMMRILLTPFIVLAYSVSFLVRIGLVVQSVFGWRKRPKNVRGDDATGVLISELCKINNSPQRCEGGYVINTHYGCRMTLPANATALEQLSPFQVFGLKIEDYEIRCVPIRLQQLRTMFVETPNSRIVQDESFQANGLPARLIVREFAAEQNQRRNVQCFVETPACYYQFQTWQNPQPTEISTLKSMVTTFETIATADE